MTWLTDLFSPAAGVALPVIYNPWLILLSIAVAIFTSTMALQMVDLAMHGGQLLRLVAQTTGSLALGSGVWTMHFVAMLAFDLCTPVTYSHGITALSMLPSLAASGVALSQIARPQSGTRDLVVGGVLVGGGIGAMHYTGMAAMVMAPKLRYDPWFFALSIVVAVALAILALWIRTGVKAGLHRLSARWSLVASGTVMGVAISGMHYTGMAAARFYGDPGTLGPAGLNSAGFLAFGVTFTTITISMLVAVTNVMLRYRSMVSDLMASESRIRAIMHTAVDGIISIGANGEIKMVNGAAEHLFGWTAEEMIGHNINFLMPEPHRSAHDSYLERYLRTGEAHIIGAAREVIALRKDGSTFPIRLAIGHARLPREDIFVGHVTDITARQQLEKDLRDAKTRAEGAAEARSAFLANMSHEIRTPMNSILGFAEVLLNSPLNLDQKQALGFVRNSARSLLRLLNEILDLAKLDYGAMEILQAPLDLQNLAEDVIATMSGTAERKKLQLRLFYAPGLGRYYCGDEFRIRQVLGNLLGNAIKFTSVGEVSLAAFEDNGQVHFTVTDTGIGIPADRIERIFDPFTQADASLSRRYGGTGLGTTISKQLVELMKGSIWVESSVGSGSRFHVLLPLTPLEEGLTEPRATEAISALPRMRILAADDVPQNLELLKMMLGNLDHEVYAVASGDEAIAQFAAKSFDVILLDLRMPGLSGLDVARRIRDMERLQGRLRTPIIALSASVLEVDRAEAADAGMDGFVPKPIELMALVREIGHALGLSMELPQSPEAATSIPVVFDRVRTLQRWEGDRAVLVNALRQFSKQFRYLALMLSKHLENGEIGEAAELVHRSRGVAANLGLVDLATTLAQLEAILGEDTSAASQAIDRVGASLDSALSAIESECSTMSVIAEASSTPSIAQPDAIAQAVATLRASLIRGSLNDESLTYLSNAVPADLFAPVRSALDDFDFPLAEMRIRQLAQHLAAIRESADHVQ